MRKKLFQINSFQNKYQTLVNEINLIEDSLKALSDSELRVKNFQLNFHILDAWPNN